MSRNSIEIYMASQRAVEHHGFDPHVIFMVASRTLGGDMLVWKCALGDFGLEHPAFVLPLALDFKGLLPGTQLDIGGGKAKPMRIKKGPMYKRVSISHLKKMLALRIDDEKPTPDPVAARPVPTLIDTSAILALEPLTWVYVKFSPGAAPELLLLLETPRLVNEGRLIRFPSYSSDEKRICADAVLSSDSSVYTAGLPPIALPDPSTMPLPAVDVPVPRTVWVDRPMPIHIPPMVGQMEEFCNVVLTLLSGESDGFKDASMVHPQIERPHMVDRNGFTWAYYGEFPSSHREYKCLQLINAVLELYPLIADHVEPTSMLNDDDFEEDDVDFLYFELRWKKEYLNDPNHNHLLKMAYAYGLASK